MIGIIGKAMHKLIKLFVKSTVMTNLDLAFIVNKVLYSSKILKKIHE